MMGLNNPGSAGTVARHDGLQRRLVAVAIDYAASEPWSPLPKTAENVKRLAKVLEPHLEVVDSSIIDLANPRKVSACVEEALDAAGSNDALVLYLAGHGDLAAGVLHIAGPQTTAGTSDVDNSIPLGWLAGRLARTQAARLLVFVDCCHAGGGFRDIEQQVRRALDADRERHLQIAIIGATHALNPVADGLLSEALCKVLESGSARWTERDRFIESNQLYRALYDETHRGQNSVSPGVDYGSIRDLGPVMPNPRWEPNAPSIELSVFDLSSAAGTHFWRAASGLDAGVEVGEASWFFTGRVGALNQAAAWLRDEHEDAPPIFVVTGPPGSGKSAILGRLALSITGAGRDLLAEVDPSFDPNDEINAVLAATESKVVGILHARERTELQMRHEIAHALHNPQLGAAATRADFIEGLRAEASAFAQRNGSRPIILVDALDEAVGQDRYAIAELLQMAAEGAGLRLLVGTRPDRLRGGDDTSPTSSSADRGLLVRLGVVEPAVDLAADEASASDVRAYMVKRLTAGPVGLTYDQDEAHRIADKLASTVGDVFLYARLAVHLVLGRERIDFSPGWVETLPELGTDTLFGVAIEADLLQRIDQPDYLDSVRAMLMGLAFAEGAGFPRPIWTTAARAISAQDLDDDDVLRTLRVAGWYLLESSQDDQAVYRLFHDELIRYFRSRAVAEYASES